MTESEPARREGRAGRVARAAARVPRPGTNRQLRRVIGRYGDGDGPLLLCLAAVHGNEPAGVDALTNLFRTLEELHVPVRGSILGLTGNLSAYARDQRFVRRDLNRGWRPKRVRSFRQCLRGTRAMHEDPESGEQRELLEILDELIPGAGGESYVLDLHTTSSASVPFLTLGVTAPSRAFARRLPLPLVAGLERYMTGTLVAFLSAMGAVGLVVEAGQHHLRSAATRHEEVLWTALVRTGMVEEDAVDFTRPMTSRLARRTQHLPSTLQVVHRHGLKTGDGFRMSPGYANFQRVEEGEPLARDAGGIIVSPARGRIFLPLYQRLGTDGFFLVREQEG